MKIKQEIIEATYSIEELTKEQYDLLKDGLREMVNRYVGTGLTIRSNKEDTSAYKLLKELEGK